LSFLTIRPVAVHQTTDYCIFTIVITGFNTDIEHEGVVYHVQTEDKGLDSPLILSLVYAGGAILASKRSRYEDLIAAGFDENALVERLRRQHRLICAAINAGRLEELKRMGARPESEVEASEVKDAKAPVIPEPASYEIAETLSSEARETTIPIETSIDTPIETLLAAPSVHEAPAVVEAEEETEAPGGGTRAQARQSAYTVYDSRRQSPLDEILEPETGVALTVLDQDEFRAGESFTIRVLLEDRSGKTEKPLAGIAVSVKILGASFRPQIYSVKTARDGVATVSTTMPYFTSGRAAVLIRAVVKEQTVELRRVLHPAA
jgi:hypothetical protein